MPASCRSTCEAGTLGLVLNMETLPAHFLRRLQAALKPSVIAAKCWNSSPGRPLQKWLSDPCALLNKSRQAYGCARSAALLFRRMLPGGTGFRRRWLNVCGSLLVGFPDGRGE